jgi:hypothetical protein
MIQEKTPFQSLKRKNTSIISCLFVAAGTCLPGSCLAMNVYSGFQVLRHNSVITLRVNLNNQCTMYHLRGYCERDISYSSRTNTETIFRIWPCALTANKVHWEGPSWEASSRISTQEYLRRLWNPNHRHSIHRGRSVVRIQRHMKSVQPLLSHPA